MRFMLLFWVINGAFVLFIDHSSDKAYVMIGNPSMLFDASTIFSQYCSQSHERILPEHRKKKT